MMKEISSETGLIMWVFEELTEKQCSIEDAESLLKEYRELCKMESSDGGLADVSDCLSIKQVAVRYGQKVKCKWLTPDGNDWLDKEITVNAHFLKEMEQGSIKDCR